MRAVIFDMDGLMIDSERVTCDGYAISLEKRGYESSVEFYKETLGTNHKTTLDMYLKRYGDDLPFYDIENEVHVYMANLFEKQGIPLKSGLIALLKYLKEHDYKTIVATSSERERVNRIFELASLHQYFDDSICGDEVQNGKPDPEVFLTACQKLGVSVEDAIVLEDSEAGIEAAYRAGIRVICVPDMKYPALEYENKAFQIYNSLEEVLTFFQTNQS